MDSLLTEERVCDTILPRIVRRDVLEEQELLEPRKSTLEIPSSSEDESGDDESHETRSSRSASVRSRSSSVSSVTSGASERRRKGRGKLKLKSKKKGKEPEKDFSAGDTGFREEMSIEETNRMRISLGLKPLC